jgi:signal transduction histidine kinase
VTARAFTPWRHASTWWTLGHITFNVLVGLVALLAVIVLFATVAGLGWTIVLAFPALWLLFVTSRGFAEIERSRFAALLELEIPDPVPNLESESWWRRVLERARSAARWKEIAYLYLLFPFGALAFLVTFAAWCGALALLGLPAYVSSLPGATAKFYAFEVGSGAESAVAAVVGLVGVLFLAPWLTVLVGRINVAFGRALLGPNVRAAQEARVRLAESGRAAAVEAAETERRRIERDLHDGAQQRLVSLAMDLGAARERFNRDPESARTLVVHAHEEAKAALQDLRDLVRGFHPAILADRGLDAALSAVVARIPLPVALVVDVRPRPPANVESTAYFVVSEALANVARHSRATEAAVSVTRAGASLIVEVRDDGVGGAHVAAGAGLSGLCDRVTALGGTLDVSSPAGGPTVVKAVLPCA